MEVIEQQTTKQCPFCAETIQVRAIKCRFCNEFLNTNKAKAIQSGQSPDSAPATDNDTPEKVLLKIRPSLWGIVGTFIKASIFLALAAALITFPIEELSIFQPDQSLAEPDYQTYSEPIPEPEFAPGSTGEFLLPSPPPQPEGTSSFGLAENQIAAIGQYRIFAGICLATLVVMILLLKIIRLKMIRYEVTSDRIEYSRGILDRRVDNLDMFRVIDMQMRRSLLDCIFGIGSIALMTTDQTDPKFTFEKIPNPRRLYEIIKTASLDSDRRNQVVHLE